MKKYQIIYADPPWRYDFSTSDSRQIENKYPTMSQEELKTLEIPADDNCILFMWATAPKLKEAFEVMEAWGFTYKSQSVWDKENMGMGYWWRGQHEILMVGVKGNMSPPGQECRESSVYREKRTEHSRKPPHYRLWISKAYPDMNKIELFARKEDTLFELDDWEGWDVIGNDIDGKDIKTTLTN